MSVNFRDAVIDLIIKGKVYRRKCEWCLDPFETIRKDAKCCPKSKSPNCKTQNARRKALLQREGYASQKDKELAKLHYQQDRRSAITECCTGKPRAAGLQTAGRIVIRDSRFPSEEAIAEAKKNLASRRPVDIAEQLSRPEVQKLLEESADNPLGCGTAK